MANKYIYFFSNARKWLKKKKKKTGKQHFITVKYKHSYYLIPKK